MLNDSSSVVVRVEGLRKRYGDLEAVRGISFEIKAGEVFGLLGPTARGKRPPSKSWKACASRTPGR